MRLQSLSRIIAPSSLKGQRLTLSRRMPACRSLSGITIHPFKQSMRTICSQGVEREGALPSVPFNQLHRSTIKSTGSLDFFEKLDLTPVIGTEFKSNFQLAELLTATNSAQLVRDLAVLSSVSLGSANDQSPRGVSCFSGRRKSTLSNKSD